MSNVSSCSKWKLALANGVANATRVRPVDQVATPTAGFFQASDNLIVNNWLKLVPMVVNLADNAQTTMYLDGWEQCTDGSWFPVEMLKATLTGCNQTGAANTIKVNYRFVDTIAIVFGAANVNVQAYSNADNVPAMLLVDTMGFRNFALSFDTGGVEDQTGNCLVAGV